MIKVRNKPKSLSSSAEAFFSQQLSREHVFTFIRSMAVKRLNVGKATALDPADHNAKQRKQHKLVEQNKLKVAFKCTKCTKTLKKSDLRT